MYVIMIALDFLLHLFHTCHGINIAFAERSGSDGTSGVYLTLESLPQFDALGFALVLINLCFVFLWTANDGVHRSFYDLKEFPY